MNIGKLSMILATMVALLVVTTGVASATTGPDCSTGRNKRGLDAGKLIGKSIVQQAWNASSQSPDDFEAFATTVRNTVHTAIHGLATDASDYVQCRAKGLAQGVCDQLGTIQDTVADACLLDGQDWGDLSAEIYCSMSESFGGLDVTDLLPHVTVHNICGENFEDGCHAEFTSSANTPTCHAFTVTPFAAVFDQAKLNMCFYETL